MASPFARRRPRVSPGSAPPRGLFERIMFSFMGPPQLGDNRAPEGFVRDPQADLCGKCGQPWDAHERVRTPSMTYTRCPQT